MEIAFALIIWAVFGFVGSAIGQKKGLGNSGCILGVLLGPLGWIVVAVMRGATKTCPQCGESVLPSALVCRYCRSDVSRAAGDTDVDLPLGRIVTTIGIALIIVAGGVTAIVLITERQPARAVAPQPTATTSSSTPEARASLALVQPRRPTPAPPAFAVDVAYSQQAAVQKHPDLAVPGSALNKSFLARLALWKSRHDPRLSKSDWPEQLAAECSTTP